MKRLLLLLSTLAPPVLAETPAERLDRQCRSGWEEITSLPDHVPLTGQYTGLSDGWCQFTDIVFVTNGLAPDIAIDVLRLKGDAFGYFTLDEALDPDLDLALQADGLRMVVQMDQPQMDWLYQAQSRAHPIRLDLALDWDMAGKVVTLSQLDVDFPGVNALSATARVAQVDLTSTATMEMSLAGFALTDATLDITTHGLFESYLLIALGGFLLPYEGDIDAAAERLRADGLELVATLPEPAFPPGTRTALADLINELPNPEGTLELDFSATPGFGPARFAGFAMSGMPETMAEAASLFQGILLTAAWTHEEAVD